MDDHRHAGFQLLLVGVVKRNRLFTVIQTDAVAITRARHVELVTSPHVADGGAYVTNPRARLELCKTGVLGLACDGINIG